LFVSAANNDDPKDRVLLLFDLAAESSPGEDPRLHPKLIQIIGDDEKHDHDPATAVRDPFHGGDIAVTIEETGRFLLWTSQKKFYRSTHTDLRHPSLNFNLVYDLSLDTDVIWQSAKWPTGEKDYQSWSFLWDRKDPDSKEDYDRLHLIGTRNSPGWSSQAGVNRADLFAVHMPEPESNRFVLEFLGTQKMRCPEDLFPDPFRLCHFAAAGGTYVSPTGELILYGLPHDDRDDRGYKPPGAPAGDDSIIYMAEFRHRDVSREDSPLRAPEADAGGPYSVQVGGTVTLAGLGAEPADRPWVELYEDKDFKGRSVVVDYDDRDLLELFNFAVFEGFDNKTSSIRWRSPIGFDPVIYEDWGYRGTALPLVGTGETRVIPVLGGGLFDKVSSLKWPEGSPYGEPQLSWDLDGDGVFGETGPAATRGDEVGATPIFDASGIDSPARLEVSLRVTVPGSARTGEDTAVIDAVYKECAGRAATIVGTRNNDLLVGTPGDDVIVGLGGNDTIKGRGGKDVICGGPGKDKLLGNAGRDLLYGGGGRDVIRGGSGRDRLYGQGGNDRLFGQGGSDRLIGGRGTDHLNGGPGIDLCRGETKISCE
jgi:hypothetical protein